jgi:hypothetical protein
MALSATVVFEVESGGSDTANGGGFDPGATFTATDLMTTNGNTASPTVSAGYSFLQSDVGSWIFVSGGTNWIQGYYQIAAIVQSTKAQLNAGVGQAVLYPSFQPNATAGCTTMATPGTTGTWAIDRSQQASPPFTYGDLKSTSPYTTITSVNNPFGPQDVGNLLNLRNRASII